MSFKIGRLHFYFLDGKGAGAVCLYWDGGEQWWNGWNLHLFVYKQFRVWGHKTDWCDGPFDFYGLGWFGLWVK